MILEPNTPLGPYIIRELIGSGGMGEVYRAQDPRLGRDVAVKIVATRDLDDETVLRFEREARAAAALTHPNILTIFDIGNHDGRPFLVSELLEGETLRERLGQGPFTPAEAVRVAVWLTRGVAAAHALKIIHRDLKPENVFLTTDGNLRILDFGLAKLKPGKLALSRSSTVHASLPGTIIGTVAYMAPEQLRGEPIDERADLFSIGAILHEMLSGSGPFTRKSGAETVAAVLNDPPPPLESAPALESLVSRCLEKDPAERFQAANDLAFALDSLRGELTHPRAPIPNPRHERSPSIAVLPFVDMSPARDQEYLCDGIAEELLNALNHIEGLRVAARRTSFQFRGSAVDIPAVGARLGVSTVLEGSVRKVGDRLRVAVQLVDVTDGYNRWSQRYDRKLEDVFAIQDEIAHSVATALRGVLTPREKEALRRPETAVESYEYFLRGRQLVHRFNRVDLEAGRRMFERAIELAPGYAPAYAGLADVHSWFYEWWGGDPKDLEAADRASEKAFELAPDLAEAHSSRGFVLSLRGQYAEAEKSFQEALRLNPNSYDAYYYYGRTCFAWGRIDRSAELFRQAAEVRQEDFQSPILLAQCLSVLGREEESREANRQGVRRAERARELDPRDARALSLGALALEKTDDPDRALCWSRRALELYPNDQSVLINAACLHARLGLREEAIDFLEKTLARGWGKRDWIENDPDLDSLRGDPRFDALIAKLR